MEPYSTALVRVSAETVHHNTTVRRRLQYAELDRHETIILREFIKHTLMTGQPITQIGQSINELLTTFCGPIGSWRLPKFESSDPGTADIARVGVRSLRFTINNSPRSERIFLWNAKRWRAKKHANRARRSEEKSENPAPGTNT